MGRLRFVLPIIFAFVIVLASSSPLFAQSPSPGPACTISVEPQTTDVNVGDEFQVRVYIRGLDSPDSMDDFSFIVAWKMAEVQLVHPAVVAVSGWAIYGASAQTAAPMIIAFAVYGNGYLPILDDGFYVTLTFKCLGPWQTDIDLITQATAMSGGTVFDCHVHHDHGLPGQVAYDITRLPGVVRQHEPAPPSVPAHVGGEVFSANKLAVLSPYLALISVVAIAAVVVRKKLT